MVARLIAFVLLCSALTSGAATRHVALDGSGTPPYDTWAKASTSVWIAIQGSASGDTILVTNGTYGTTVFTFATNLTIQSVNGPSVTILHAGGGDNYIQSEASYTLSGVTVAGYTGSYAALIVYTMTATITNCVFRGNKGVGGAIEHYAESTSIVHNCTFFDNTGGSGAAVYHRVGTARTSVSQCTFSNNIATVNGGALFALGTMAVNRSVFTRNTAPDGLAIFAHTLSPSLIVSNSLFAFNFAPAGYGVVRSAGGARDVRRVVQCLFYGNQELYYTTAGLLLESCTLVGNRSTDQSYKAENAAIYSCDAINSIAWHNIPNDIGQCRVTNSCYQIAGTGGSGTNSTTSYPLFVDDYTATNDAAHTGSNFVLGASGEFQLQVTSPCKDTGTNQAWMASAVDYWGGSRIQNAVVDMGAYEYTPSVAVLDDSAAEAMQIWWREIR